jgi:hemoglobin-like flavoprotein
MVIMINSAIEQLGPDLDLLEDDLFCLGTRHIGYGVKEEFLPIMGQAVSYALATLLKKEYTKEHKRSWKMIMKFMVKQMALGMKAVIHKLTLDVTMLRNALKNIPNYKDIAGTIIYAKSSS